jgi:hypothetical protein
VAPPDVDVALLDFRACAGLDVVLVATPLDHEDRVQATAIAIRRGNPRRLQIWRLYSRLYEGSPSMTVDFVKVTG